MGSRKGNGAGREGCFPLEQGCVFLSLVSVTVNPASLPIKCFGVHTQPSLAVAVREAWAPSSLLQSHPESQGPSPVLSQEAGQSRGVVRGTLDLFGLRRCSPVTAKASRCVERPIREDYYAAKRTGRKGPLGPSSVRGWRGSGRTRVGLTRNCWGAWRGRAVPGSGGGSRGAAGAAWAAAVGWSAAV